MEVEENRNRLHFRKKWLRDHSWLRYGKSGDNKGGWCLPCILFLIASESASLHFGVFVKTLFINYNKSKEILEKHAVKDYHSQAVDRAYITSE